MIRPCAARRRTGAALTSLVLGASVLFAVTSGVSAKATEIITPTSSGNWVVDGHGNGHGHGLSQYGARGAASRGLTAAQILAFYYPGTTLTRLSQPTIRVRITDDASSTTVGVPAGQTMTLRWSGGTLSTTSAHASKLRLIAAAGGRLQAQYYRTSWLNWGGVLPASADLSSSAGYVRLYQSGGSTDYRGTVGAVIAGGIGRITVNRLALDAYTQGVVPREMPASWQAAAVQAQAVAARSYARYAIEHSGGAAYDICDSTNCQVYGGKARYTASGALAYSEESASNSAVGQTSNTVLTYQSATIFAQFSASDGGWTTDGGQPYLPAKADPYEQYAQDPYFNWQRVVSIAGVAASYGLSRITQIAITGRDGHGQWGGRVLTATVSGVNRSGAATSIATSGGELAGAMGLPHEWFHVQAIPASAPQSVTATSRDGAALVSWAAPASSGSDAITGYSVLVANVQRVIAPAGARSAWIGGLQNGRKYTAQVQAITSAGSSTPAMVTLSPIAAPDDVVAVNPSRLFDTRTGKLAITPTRPFVFGVGGHGSIPTGTDVTAVQLTVTIVSPTASGQLRVTTDGSPTPPIAAINYRAGQSSTATVSVPLVTSGRLRFSPSAGSMSLLGDQLGYSKAAGSRLATVAPSLVADMRAVGTGNGRLIPVRGGSVPADANAVLMQLVLTGSSVAGFATAWPSGSALPAVSPAWVSAGGRSSSTLLVPIGADGAIRLAATNASIGGQLSIVGYLAPAAAGRGKLETVPPTPIADTLARVGSDLAVSRTARTLSLHGAPQLPASGFDAVLVQLTVSGASASGALRAYADGSAAPRGVTLALQRGVSQTATVLLPVNAAGVARLVTDGPNARVAVDVLGYASTG